MSFSVILFGILPLIAFVIIDSLSGVKAGVIAAILLALLETIYSLVVYRDIDSLTIGSTLLVLFFGLWSWRSKDPIYIKLQPVVIGVVFGVVLLVMQFLGKPLMVIMAEKYRFALPEEMQTAIIAPHVLKLLAHLSYILGFGFIIHAAAVGYAAFYLNKWWWIVIRGIGFYVMLACCMIFARFSL